MKIVRVVFTNLVVLHKGFLKWSFSTLYHLQFWRYCTISFPYKNHCLQITAEVSKIRKSAQCDLTFVLIELSETLNSFVKIRLVFEIRNVASFIKTRFYLKRFYLKRGCIKMRKHAETFRANKGCNLAIVFLYQFRRFQNRNLGCNFQTLFARKRGLATPYFFYENKSLRHCLLYYLRRFLRSRSGF